MSKHYLSLLSFATLLCMILFGASSCKKDDTSDPNNADFFIDVDFLPESETNGEVAPRLVVNFNDEAAMIELRRPSTSDPMESVLLLCPDKEAMMLCGNDSIMVCATYDMDTYTPSHDVLIVTPMDDDAMLLTKGFMDWYSNTLTTSDMMVLPVNDNSKNRENRGDIDGEIRSFFFNRFVKRLANNFNQVANYSGVFKVPGTVFSYIGATLTTDLTAILYADDPEGLTDAMKFSVTNWATQAAPISGVLNLLSRESTEMLSITSAVKGWFTNGGHGAVDDYEGGTSEFAYPSIWSQSGNVIRASDLLNIQSPAYNVSLNVSNVTENSAYLKGRFQYTSSITPVEMGYIFKISGGPEHIEHDMNFQGITLSGLQKATKYTAFAYVKGGFGERVLSPGVTFWTLGFEAFPNSLTFPTEGDTKFVGLSYSEEDITRWDITSKPSWCNTTIDDLGLLAVTVGASTEARSGTITITAHSNTLGNVTENIEVTQIGANGWDGTSWVFSGTITTHDYEGQTTSQEMTLTLMVNSVSNKDIEFSWAQALSAAANHGYSDNYVLNGNGNLVYSATAGYSGDWGNNNITSQVTFARTGSTTATANLQYRESFSNYFVTMSGVLQGTLIRADEVGNYETTINLKTPIFDNKALKNN